MPSKVKKTSQLIADLEFALGNLSDNILLNMEQEKIRKLLITICDTIATVSPSPSLLVAPSNLFSILTSLPPRCAIFFQSLPKWILFDSLLFLVVSWPLPGPSIFWFFRLALMPFLVLTHPCFVLLRATGTSVLPRTLASPYVLWFYSTEICWHGYIFAKNTFEYFFCTFETQNDLYRSWKFYYSYIIRLIR